MLKEEIEFSKFAELVPKSHLPGLKLLLDKEMFLDCHDEVLHEKKMIEMKMAQDAEKRLAGKKRRGEKAEENAKQLRVDQLFKS